MSEPSSETKKHVFDDPKNVERLIRTLYVVCAVALSVDLLDTFGLTHFKHGHFAVESFPGFYGLYGLIGCSLLVFAAKALRRIVGRKEDYYEPVDEAVTPGDGDSP